MTPDQVWSNRLIMGYAAYREPIAGLYHSGAGAHPGGVVTGLPGRNVAREIVPGPHVAPTPKVTWAKFWMLRATRKGPTTDAQSPRRMAVPETGKNPNTV